MHETSRAAELDRLVNTVMYESIKSGGLRSAREEPLDQDEDNQQ